MDIRLAKAYLESTLITFLRPHFLSIEEVDGTIHIIVCHPKFKPMDTISRIKLVFDLFKAYNFDVTREFVVIVEAYDSDQMQTMLEELY